MKPLSCKSKPQAVAHWIRERSCSIVYQFLKLSHGPGQRFLEIKFHCCKIWMHAQTALQDNTSISRTMVTALQDNTSISRTMVTALQDNTSISRTMVDLYLLQLLLLGFANLGLFVYCILPRMPKHNFLNKFTVCCKRFDGENGILGPSRTHLGWTTLLILKMTYI